MWQYNYGPELAHYGVKGMKWGVRRYQNYDGSYTKKGLERYNKAESDYESAKAKQKQIKSDHKKGTATKQDVKKANQDVKSAKKKMSDAYGRLKTDKLADEGRELYKQGKTITANTQRNAMAQAAIVLGSNAASRIIASRTGDLRVAALSSRAIAIGGTAVNAMLAVKTSSDNKRLRAYYADGGYRTYGCTNSFRH